MEDLYIEEEEADVDNTSDQVSQQTYTQTRGLKPTQSKTGPTLGQHMHLSHPHKLHNSSNMLSASNSCTPTWPSSTSQTTPAPKSVLHRNDDIDKLLMDLENLSQSMSHPRNTEPPLPAKTRKREGGQGITSSDALSRPKMVQFQMQKPDSHLAMNGSISRTSQSLTLRQGEMSEAVVGEEEDGALLLRILESIESFAQELVDSGAGSTGSAEKNSGKEREVMRLLQGTLATTGRVDSPLESSNTLAPSTTPSVHTPAVPAIPPKQSHANTPAYLPSPPTPGTGVSEPEADSVSKPLPSPTPEPTPEATDKAAETSSGETDHKSVVPSVKSTPASSHSSSHLAEPAPVEAPEAPAPAVLATKDSTGAFDSAALRDTGSTLLIQQTPEVIRVSE